jgi:hypothetical protein
MTRRGRPRQSELAKIRAIKSDGRAWLRNEIRRSNGNQQDRFKYAFDAACVLHTLEQKKLSPAKKAVSQDRTLRLRQTSHGAAVDRYGKLPDPEFLEAFIKRSAPDWPWREYQVDSAQLDEKRKLEDRSDLEKAASDRFVKAIRNRFVTPETPGLDMLRQLRGARPDNLNTWPTARILKLAMAIPERTIKKIVAKLQPKPKQTEIVTIPLRNVFSRRGAVPKRYHPRLVLAVVNDFISRLPDSSIGDKERKQFHKTAMTVKRALMLRLRA